MDRIEADQRGRVMVEIGGRQLVMRMNLGAMARAQKVLGVADFSGIIERMLKVGPDGRPLIGPDGKPVATLDFVTLQGLIWAALGDNPDPPSMRWLGEVIDSNQQLTALSDAVGVCIEAMISGPGGQRAAAAEGEAENPPEASPPVG